MENPKFLIQFGEGRGTIGIHCSFSLCRRKRVCHQSATERERESASNMAAMAWRLPTQLATPGKLHHHNDSKTTAYQSSFSWCRTLAADHLLPSSSSSSSSSRSTIIGSSSSYFYWASFNFCCSFYKIEKNPFFLFCVCRN